MQLNPSNCAKRTTRVLVIAGVLACVGACTPSYDPGMRPVDVTTGLSGPPGQNKTATKNWLSNAQWEPEVSQDFACAPKCGTEDFLKLDFSAVTHAKGVEWHTLKKGHGKGHYLVKIHNRNSVAYAPWGIPANDSAYLWMGETADKRPTAGLYHFDSDYNVDALAGALKVGICFKDNSGPSQVHFDQGCVAPAVAGFGKSVDLASNTGMLMSRTPMAISSRSGLWVSCSSGCCEVQLGY